MLVYHRVAGNESADANATEAASTSTSTPAVLGAITSDLAAMFKSPDDQVAVEISHWVMHVLNGCDPSWSTCIATIIKFLVNKYTESVKNSVVKQFHRNWDDVHSDRRFNSRVRLGLSESESIFKFTGYNFFFNSLKERRGKIPPLISYGFQSRVSL